MFEFFYFNADRSQFTLAFIWKWPGKVQARLKRVAREKEKVLLEQEER
jgi:hypothetical protein